MPPTPKWPEPQGGIQVEDVEGPGASAHDVVAEAARQRGLKLNQARTQGGVLGEAGQILVAAQAPGGQSPQGPGRRPHPIGGHRAARGLLDSDDASAWHRHGQKGDLVRGGGVGREDPGFAPGRPWVGGTAE